MLLPSTISPKSIANIPDQRLKQNTPKSSRHTSSSSTISSTNATYDGSTENNSNPSSSSCLSSEPGSSARLTTNNIIDHDATGTIRRTLRKRDQNTNYTEPGSVIPYRDETWSASGKLGKSTAKHTISSNHTNKNNTRIAEKYNKTPESSLIVPTSKLIQLLGEASNNSQEASIHLNIDPSPKLESLTNKPITPFPTTIDLKNAKITDDRTILRLANGQIKIQKGDTIYLVCEPPSEPYYIGKVMGFQPKDHLTARQTHTYSAKNEEDASDFQIRMNWYYRPRDISKQSSDSRLLYASLHSDLCPLDSYRGHVTVRHKDEVKDMEVYKARPDTFWFDKLYDRYLARFYDVVGTDYSHVNATINSKTGKWFEKLPIEYIKALNKRYEYVFFETGKARDLFDLKNRGTCEGCSQWCPGSEAVRCDVCSTVFHSMCLDAGMGKRSLVGVSWICPKCLVGRRNILEELRQTSLYFLKHDKLLNISQRRAREEWTYRYIGINTTLENCLELNSSAYPRMSSRVAARYQWNGVQDWLNHKLEYYDMGSLRPDIRNAEEKRKAEAHAALIKRRKKLPTRKLIEDDPLYLEQKEKKPLQIPSAYKDKNPSQFPFWLQERPVGYVERGGDDGATAKLLWNPRNIGNLTFSKIDQYIQSQAPLAKSLNVNVYSPNFMDAILNNLYKCNFNIKDATLRNQELTRLKLKEPTLTQEEVRQFEASVRKHGNELHHVTKEVRTQPYGMIVRHYYMWKKTEQGIAIWGNYPGRKKKKAVTLESINPTASPTKVKPIPTLNEEEESLTTSDQLSRSLISSRTHCKHCLAATSSTWYHVQPTEPQPSTNVVSALCSRCARLWRRYAVQWIDPLSLLRQLGWLSVINSPGAGSCTINFNGPPSSGFTNNNTMVTNNNSVIDFSKVLDNCTVSSTRRKAYEWELVWDTVGICLILCDIGGTGGVKRSYESGDSVTDNKRSKIAECEEHEEVIDIEEDESSTSDEEEKEYTKDLSHRIRSTQGVLSVKITAEDAEEEMTEAEELLSFGNIEHSMNSPEQDLTLASPERKLYRSLIAEIKSESSSVTVKSVVPQPSRVGSTSKSSSLVPPPSQIYRDLVTKTLIEPPKSSLSSFIADSTGYKRMINKKSSTSNAYRKSLKKYSLDHYELFNENDYRTLNAESGNDVCFNNFVGSEEDVDYIPLCLRFEEKEVNDVVVKDEEDNEQELTGKEHVVTIKEKEPIKEEEREQIIEENDQDIPVPDADSDTSLSTPTNCSNEELATPIIDDFSNLTETTPNKLSLIPREVIARAGLKFNEASKVNEIHTLNEISKEVNFCDPADNINFVAEDDDVEEKENILLTEGTKIEGRNVLEEEDSSFEHFSPQISRIQKLLTASERNEFLERSSCLYCLATRQKAHSPQPEIPAIRLQCTLCQSPYHDICYQSLLNSPGYMDSGTTKKHPFVCLTCLNEQNPVISLDHRCFICKRGKEESIMGLCCNERRDWFHVQCLCLMTNGMSDGKESNYEYFTSGIPKKKKEKNFAIDRDYTMHYKKHEDGESQDSMMELIPWGEVFSNKSNAIVPVTHPVETGGSAAIKVYIDWHRSAYPWFWCLENEIENYEEVKNTEQGRCVKCSDSFDIRDEGTFREKFLCEKCHSELHEIQLSNIYPSDTPEFQLQKTHAVNNSNANTVSYSYEKLMSLFEKNNELSKANNNQTQGARNGNTNGDLGFSLYGFETRLQVLRWDKKTKKK